MDKTQVKGCFWCMKAFDDGREIDSDKEIMLLESYEPCDRCKEIYSHGIRMIGVSEEPIFEGQPPISGNPDTNEYLYPAENVFVAPVEMVKQMLADNQELLDTVLESKVMLMPDEHVKSYIDQARNMEAPIQNIGDEEE